MRIELDENDEIFIWQRLSRLSRLTDWHTDPNNSDVIFYWMADKYASETIYANVQVSR